MGERETISDLSDLLYEVALPAIRKRRLPYWISTPDGDQGGDWCGDCGRAKVRNLRSRDRKHREEYFLDGGWRTEEEHMSFCAGCGADLDVCLLRYGVEGELEYFRSCGVRPGNSHDAMCLYETLNYFGWVTGTEAELAHEAIETAEAFLFAAT